MDRMKNIKFNILAIVCIIIFAVTLAPKTLQNDTFYTISIGEHIMEHGVDMQDPFAWTELRYTYPHWLYDVFIYNIYNIGGMLGIYISTMVLSAILGIILYITCLKVNKNNLFSFALTIGVLFLIRHFIAARAQLVTYILFILEILFVECFLETKKKRYAIRINGNCMLNCKSTCSSFLYVLYTFNAILWRVYNSFDKRGISNI